MYPVWEHMSDFTISARVDDDPSCMLEQLWAKQTQPYQFQICCIPAFVRNIALGDIVATDKDYLVKEVVLASGRIVFRAWSDNGWLEKREVIDRIVSHGGLIETCTHRLIAIDVDSWDQATSMRSLLDSLEKDGILEYETGYR